MKRIIAEELLRIGAVFLRPDKPFTWASGIQSPIYCDNRLVLSEPAARAVVEQALADTVRREHPACAMLLGTSTAGIGHAAIAAHLLGMPMGYVRAAAKEHGRGNQIEGKMEPGTHVVIIEDLISTAGSVLDTVRAVRAAGGAVLGIVSLFTYGMQKGLDRMRAEQVENISLTDFDTIVAVAAETGYIAQADQERLLRFRDNPEDAGWMR